MEKRIFGRTGLELSVLGFGCGAVGGLMVRGDPLDQERTIARAIGAGVNYFDTAVQYGNGQSEKNLGSHPTAAEASRRGRRHESLVAERQFQPHCRCRSDIARTQPDATAA
jgi:aryl-alcohol dehydrogenase-like predicted oxidoreductase